MRLGLRRAETWLPWTAAVAVVIGSWFTLWFHEYEPDLDAMSLFNPVYMVEKTGRASYPIYAYPTDMVIHPPTHYWVLAEIMRITGLTAQAAAFMPVLFWIVVAAVLTASSRWRPSIKIGVLFAIWFGLVVWPIPNFIRPDVHVAVAWVAGLVALETGRVGGWNPWRLAVGSFALAFASTLHYPATLAFIGLLPYAVLALLRWRERLRSVAALVVPAGAVMLFYLLAFWVPHYADIRRVTATQNGQGHGLFAAFDQTRQAYEFFASQNTAGPVLEAIMWPVLNWGIPAALVGPAVLALFRQTRLLALASVPLLFTLLFYARAKTYYYYAPDFFIYTAAFGVAIAVGVEALFARRRAPLTAAVATVCVAAAAAGVFAQPVLSRIGTFRWHPLHADIEVARAAGTKLVPAGTTALTNDLALWYVTGADRVYYPRDLDNSTDLRGLNLRRYLGSFGAVVEESYDTWSTVNSQRLNITSFYLRGMLHLNGFYFGRSWSPGAPTIVRYLVMSTRKKPLHGYAWDGDRVAEFAQAKRGDWALIGADCPAGGPPLPGGTWQTALLVPGATASTVTIQRLARIGLVAPADVGAARAAVAARCKPLFEAHLRRVGTTPVRRFVSDWRNSPRARTVIKFPQTDASATTALYAPTQPTRVVHTVDLTKASGFGATSTQHVRRSLYLRLDAPRFYLMYLTRLPDPGTENAWLKVRVQVVQGLVALCAGDYRESTCHGRINLAPGGHQTVYLRVGSARRHLKLYMDKQADGNAVVALESIQLVAAR